MYPLNVIAVDCDDTLLPPLRSALSSISAHIEAESPTVEDAIASFRAPRDGKRLFLYHVRSVAHLANISRLCDKFPGWPILALLNLQSTEEHDLSGALLAALRAGASQLVLLPLNSVDLTAAMDRIAAQFVEPEKEPFIIAVAGATGGCGATTVAINVADEIAHRRHLRCILIDLSLKLGMVATYLDMKIRYNILDLVRDITRVDPLLLKQFLVKVADNFEVLPGPDQLITPPPPSFEDLARVIDVASQMADVVVLDVPTTYDDLFFKILSAAHFSVLVGDQKIPTLRALKMLHDVLDRNPPQQAEHIVINRYDSQLHGFTADDLARTLGVSSLHTIAEDRTACGDALNHGCTLRREAPSSHTLLDIDGLVDVLVPQIGDTSTPACKLGLLGRLRRALVSL